MSAARRLAFAAALAVTLASGAPRAESDSAGRIAHARALIADAGKALDAAHGEKTRLAALGQAIDAHEIALAALRTGLRELAAAEAAATQRIAAQLVPLGRLLGALQSISQAPPSALLAVPGGPLEASRAAMLMAAITPELDRRITVLEHDLAAVADLRAGQQAARLDARAALAGLQDLRAATAAALGRRDRAGLASRADLRRQADEAAAMARNFDTLAAALRQNGEAVSAGPAFATAQGKLPLPVAGRLVAEFGAPDPWGRPGQGWSIEAPAFAQVTAPWDATVRFAGPLIDYDQVVVLEPEAGYLVVLAGLGRIDREAGESVLAGEPLGDLGGQFPTGDQFLLDVVTVDGQIERKALYIEIRRSGRSLDPADWFDLTGSEEIR